MIVLSGVIKKQTYKLYKTTSFLKIKIEASEENEGRVASW